MLSQKTTKLSLEDSSGSEATTLKDDRDEENGLEPLEPPDREIVPAENIVEKFTQATRALSVGSLVKDKDFQLFDAIGALEIGDPKMDGGLILNVKSPEDEYDVLQELSLGQVIGVMDQLLCFEMSWHAGFPLSRTLFASHYIDRLLSPPPTSLEEANFHRNGKRSNGNKPVHLLLRAYCIALIKTCSYVFDCISNEKYYEEEDFNSHCHDRDLLSTIDCAEILGLLEEASAYIQRSQNNKYDDRWSAIGYRLDLRHSMLRAAHDEALLAMDNGSWQESLGTFPIVDASRHLAESVPGAYSEKLQLNLASTWPPKPLVELSFGSALESLKSMIHHCIEAHSILQISSIESFLTFVRLFNSRASQPLMYPRSLMSNLFWHNNLVLGRYSFKEMIFLDLAELIIPMSNITDMTNDEVEAPHDPRFQISRAMDDFARRIANPFIDLFTLHCQNRARFRRLLCHSIDLWNEIQLDAREVDMELRKFADFNEVLEDSKLESHLWHPLCAWAKRHKVQQMMWTIQLGFELDLYQPLELSSMYWLLADYAHTHMNLLVDAQAFNDRRRSALDEHETKERSVFIRTLNQLEVNYKESQGVYDLACALSGLYAVLAHMGFFPEPFQTELFSNPTRRYNMRMAPFITIKDPPCPTFEQIRELVTITDLVDAADTSEDVKQLQNLSPRMQPLAMLLPTTKSFKRAKDEIANFSRLSPLEANYRGSEGRWKTDMQKTLKACIAGNVAVAEIEKGLKDLYSAGIYDRPFKDIFEVEIPNAKTAHHPWWLVPKVKVRKR